MEFNRYCAVSNLISVPSSPGDWEFKQELATNSGGAGKPGAAARHSSELAGDDQYNASALGIRVSVRGAGKRLEHVFLFVQCNAGAVIDDYDALHTFAEALGS